MAERGDLATLLRAWRDRLSPSTVGLPSGDRRTSGLRREEVAMLAGLSVDYVVRLEQGRADRPSAQVVSALARVLQVSDLERDQLFLAAGLVAPLPTMVPTHIPASVQRLLVRMPDVALSVFTISWTLLTSNAPWVSLFGSAMVDMNLVVRQFSDAPIRVVRSAADTEQFERALVSDLRVALIRYPQDPSLRSLVAGLNRTSDRFAAIWTEGAIVEHVSGRKTFLHQLVGEVTLDCDVFTGLGTDLRIVAYTAAPGTEDASRFDLIRTLGAGAQVAGPAAGPAAGPSAGPPATRVGGREAN